MEIDLACPLCSNDYAENNPARLLPCGHTFCHNCLLTLLQEQQASLVCPDDQRPITLSGTPSDLPKNIALMKLVQGRKKNTSNNSSSSMKDASFDMSKINKEEEGPEDDLAQELITQINRASLRKEEDSVKSAEQNTAQTSAHLKGEKTLINQCAPKVEIELCLLHQRPVEVICMNDHERLCSKCALFGEHKSHEFKGIEQIQRENTNYYHQIITMFEQKAVLMEKVAAQTVEKDLLELLTVKTNKLRKGITDHFRKWQEELATAEKAILRKLEASRETIGQKLQTALKMDCSLIRAYDKWEVNTLEAIKQSERPCSEGHLAFYLKKNDILEQGKRLSCKIKQSQEVSYGYSVQVIEDFSTRVHEGRLQQALQGIVQIVDFDQEQQMQHLQQLRQKENEAALANCHLDQIKKAPQLHRQESDQSLLDACDFETHSFVDSTVGSRILDQSFVSVKEEPSNHQAGTRDKPVRPAVKRKLPLGPKETMGKQKPMMAKEGPSVNVKKKMKSLKVPEKYEKVLQGISNDTLETVDLTNAELGDATVLQVLELMRCSGRVKTVKLIRNKLSDEGVLRMLPLLGSVVSLNLSQNQLTEQTLNLLIENRAALPLLKSVVLCQTKIIERKSKLVIQKLKKLDVAVSV